MYRGFRPEDEEVRSSFRTKVRRHTMQMILFIMMGLVVFACSFFETAQTLVARTPAKTAQTNSCSADAARSLAAPRPELSGADGQAARAALEQLTTRRDLLVGSPYQVKVMTVWGKDNWAVGELGLMDTHGEIPPSDGNVAIAEKLQDGSWTAYEKGTEEFNRILHEIPDDWLSPEAKVLLYVANSRAIPAAESSGLYKLPFACTQRAYVTQVHADGGQVYDIDFAIVGGEILAARDGWIAQIREDHNECCYDSKCAPCNNYVVIRHEDGEYSYYLHIQQNSVPDTLAVGTFVKQGTVIARQGDVGWSGGNGRSAVPCNGSSVGGKCGVHLHFGVHKGPYWNQVTVRPRFEDVAGSYVLPGKSYVSGNCPPAAELWSEKSFQGSKNWSGGVGFFNEPNADANSLKLPAGWSARTWRGDNKSGEMRCWSVSEGNLGAFGWQSAIQSIEVFDRNVCVACQPLTLAHSGNGGDPAVVPISSEGCPAGQYVAGTTVQLTAAPAAGWRVSGWTGTANDKAITATNSAVVPAGGRQISVQYVAVPVPANDDFARPTLLRDGSAPIVLDTDSATTAADDPQLPCIHATGAKSVWFSYTAPTNGQVTFDTAKSNFDTVLAVWTGKRGALANVACNDNAGAKQALVTFAAKAGQQYYIEVVGFDSSAFGTLQLAVAGQPGVPTPPKIYLPVTLHPLPTQPKPTPVPLPTTAPTPTPAVVPGITGRVTYYGAPVADAKMALMVEDSSLPKVVTIVATDMEGKYRFAPAPLQPGQRYYVRFLNGGDGNRFDSRFTSAWMGPYITSYTATGQVSGGDLKIGRNE